MPDYKETGKRLRIVRGKLTQEAFAKSVGVSASYVKKTELGSKPSLEYLMNIATLYAVSLDWLLLGPDREAAGAPAGKVDSPTGEIPQKLTAKPAIADSLPGSIDSRQSNTGREDDDPDLRNMVEVLRTIMYSENKDLRSWAKIQFQHAFYFYLREK